MRNIISVSVTLLLLIALQGFTGPAAYAQSETGNISGVVTSQDGSTGLSGASVRIKDLNRQTTTDQLGRFRITGIPTGEHEAVVTYFGSEPFTTPITVEAGENTDIQLLAADPTLEEVVVQGVIANIYASRSMERAADGYKSVIAADAVGEFGDQNIAEALNRMPAVAIQRNEGEGNYVSIRGLQPGFATVTINGTQVGTDGDARGSSLQFIGNNMLSALEITKSLTPDMLASATAGQVNIITASAFRKGGNSLSATLEASYQDISGEVSPKIMADGTWLNSSKSFGVAWAVNYYNRYIDGNEYLNDDGLDWYESNTTGEEYLMPGEIDNRREEGERERINVSLGLEWRPTGQDEFFSHLTLARVEDHDLKIREAWELDKASGNEVVELTQNSFVLTDQELASDLWLQEVTNDSYTIDFGGDHTRDLWNTRWVIASSESEGSRYGSARAQWEEKDFAVRGNWGRDFGYVEPIPFDEAQNLPDISSKDVKGDATDPSKFDWVRIWFDDSVTTDTVNSARFDVTRDLVMGNTPGYVKFGMLYTDREVFRDSNRPQFNPSDGDLRDKACGDDQACHDLLEYNMDDFGELQIPPGSGMLYPTPSLKNTMDILKSVRHLVPLALAGDTLVDDVVKDYTSAEEVTAAYVMGSFDFSERIRLVGGVRVEKTDFASTGWLAMENDDFIFPGDTVEGADIYEFLGTAKNSYTDWFPSATFRFTPSDTTVLRASISRSTKRPNFSWARNSAILDDDIAFIDVETGDEIDPDDGPFTEEEYASWRLDVGGKFEIGNPELKPMMSTNYDLSLGWYPSESTYLSFAVFRKDITDWVAEIRLRDVTFAELPVEGIPNIELFQFDDTQEFDNVHLALNGDKATVNGIELALSHVFANGFFIDANAAWMDSDATLELRDDKLPLIGQAEDTANLSVGYQNDHVSLRLSYNHRGKYLEEIAGSDDDSMNDIYARDYDQVDFNARWYIGDKAMLYFDAINLTDENEVLEWRGIKEYGPAYAEIQQYGKTYQLGLRYTFF